MEFIKKQVVEITGLKPQTVAYYTTNIPIIPEVAVPEKRGSNRKYSIYNLVEFSVVKELTGAGMSLAICREIIAHMRYARGQNQHWITDILFKRKPIKWMYAFIYDVFDSDKIEVKYETVNAAATNLVHSGVDGKHEITLDHITRERNGKLSVTILNLSNIIQKVSEGLTI
jgi:DNA-binding transcriptional MerR regulator